MQTECPRNEMPPEQPARKEGICLSITDDTAESGPTDADLELIDLRYEQFVAQSRLDNLMYEH